MRSCSIPLMVVLAALALAGPARAGGLVLSAANFDDAPGTTGSFLVTLTNTDATDATLSAYQIQLTTDVAGLSFTGVAQPMAPRPRIRLPRRLRADLVRLRPAVADHARDHVHGGRLLGSLGRLRHAGGGPDVRRAAGRLRDRPDGPTGHGAGLVRQPGLIGPGPDPVGGWLGQPHQFHGDQRHRIGGARAVHARFCWCAGSVCSQPDDALSAGPAGRRPWPSPTVSRRVADNRGDSTVRVRVGRAALSTPLDRPPDPNARPNGRPAGGVPPRISIKLAPDVGNSRLDRQTVFR